ncbi:MAG: hypothetical protein H6822_17715 [Planctomycetaceae bacterium]|nr:hypothetical protein [Planctomycetales bacterium]MCB9924024.1 hypothetical protein [Planctomycetaceae bacterium]
MLRFKIVPTAVYFVVVSAVGLSFAQPSTLPALTTLSDSSIKYEVPAGGYHMLERGDVRAVVVDNRAVDDAVLPGHRAKYSGVASLTHKQQADNLFVPSYAGLNYEHIHDGTNQDRDILFEPRNAQMELRVVDQHTVELYQPPTPHWQLESVLRYAMLVDGAIEMTLECIPRAKTFANGYIGLFWASYIHQPTALSIHFRGHVDRKETSTQWILGTTPKHGVYSTHVGDNDTRSFQHDEEFALTLVFNRSRYRYDEPWYFGVSRGMAFVQMFRPQDAIWLSQSPSGGGEGNPAWDFQYFIPNYKVGQRYQMIMRAMYLPYESHEQIQRVSQPHRKALGRE